MADAAFFKMKTPGTYDCRSKATGRMYVFSGDSVVRVTEDLDIEKFRHMDMFVETDQGGNILAQSGGVPQAAFSAKGMTVPRSYVKVQAAQPVKPEVPEPAPRTVTSSKKSEESDGTSETDEAAKTRTKKRGKKSGSK